MKTMPPGTYCCVEDRGLFWGGAAENVTGETPTGTLPAPGTQRCRSGIFGNVMGATSKFDGTVVLPY